MNLMRSLMFGVLCMFGTHVVGQDVVNSKRPMLRPLALEALWSGSKAPVISLRPKLRPSTIGRSETAVVVQKAVIEQTITEDIIVAPTVKKAKEAEQITAAVKKRRTNPIASLFSKQRTSRPKHRPKGLRTALLDRSKRKKSVKYGKKGSVCGVPGIRGYSVKRIGSKGGCGIAAPVKINEVDGVKLTREALVGCDTAKALYNWVQQDAKPAVGRKGGGLGKIQMIAGYACRNRNSAKKGRLSEHAKGNAVDIAGFVLKDGTTMTVLKGWRSKAHGPTLKSLHKSACGPFKTVLGPNANRFHQDHFHFDVAKHRGGSTYCR